MEFLVLARISLLSGGIILEPVEECVLSASDTVTGSRKMIETDENQFETSEITFNTSKNSFYMFLYKQENAKPRRTLQRRIISNNLAAFVCTRHTIMGTQRMKFL